MEMDARERTAMIMGIVFAVWFMGLLYLLINAIWLGVAAAVVVGVVILFIARSMSRRTAG